MRSWSPWVLTAVAACAQSTPQGSPDATEHPIDGPAAPDAATPPDAAAPADAEVAPDATVAARSFTDDISTDFAASAMVDATVEDFGAIAPVAYYTGGLLQHGSDTGYFTDPAAATWAQVQGYPPTARVAITWLTKADWLADTPPSVGLTDGDTFSEWFEGEVYLDAGTWTFSLLVDDHGFVELAPPGSTAFQRVLSANWATETSGNFVAATAGWYPIHAAIAEEAGNALYDLELAGPGVAKQPIPRDRMRVRADRLQGMVEAGFDDGHGTGDVETTIDPLGPGNTNWNTGNPGDLGMTASDTFSVRWTGQVRVDTAGTYTFRYVTDDGQRLWIDGQKVLDSWGDTVVDQTTAPIALAAGWHDLVIEQTEALGGAQAVLTVASGPAGVGLALPVALLRPVEGRAERVSAGANHADVAIPDVTTITSTAAVAAPAAALVTSVDVSYQFTHTFWSDLAISLRAPNGASYTLRNHASGANGDTIERFTIATLNGVPVDGTWTLVVADTVGGDSGTLEDFEVTPHWSGGTAPIPTSASFDSSVRDLGVGVTSIDAVTWAERLPAGADIAVRVRTGDTAAACAAATWSTALTTPGGAPAVPPGRYLQYRVELSSDGDHAPVLDSLRVDYSASP